MEMLKNYVQVKVMLRLLEESGQKEPSAEASRLIAAMDNMNQQHDAFMSEISGAQQQILLASEQHYPLHHFCHEMTMATHQWAGELHFWLAKNREQVILGATTAVARLNRMYIPPWNKAESVSATRGYLETMRERINAEKESIAEYIGKLEAMVQTPPSTDGHLESIMGIAYDLDDVYTERFQDALTSLRSAHSTIEHMDQEICAALDAVSHLERLRERSSVRQRLETKVPARPSPEPSKRPREAER